MDFSAGCDGEFIGQVEDSATDGAMSSMLAARRGDAWLGDSPKGALIAQEPACK